MSNRSTFAKAGLATLAGVLMLCSAAQAQPYGSYGYYGSGPNYSYDACKREKTTRGTIGALIGGVMGAVIGSQAAASGHRTDGSMVGGALGAAVGAGVGNSAAACANGQMVEPMSAPPPAPPPPPAAYNDRYDRYGEGYGRGAYRYEDRDYAYGRRGERFPMAEGRGLDAAGCTLAESPIHMPDGRTQTRFVRVCRDANGRYQVVD
jgi:hypothetical protein